MKECGCEGKKDCRKVQTIFKFFFGDDALPKPCNQELYVLKLELLYNFQFTIFENLFSVARMPVANIFKLQKQRRMFFPN